MFLISRHGLNYFHDNKAWGLGQLQDQNKQQIGETNSGFMKPSDEQTIYFAQEKFAFR